MLVRSEVAFSKYELEVVLYNNPLLNMSEYVAKTLIMTMSCFQHCYELSTSPVKSTLD